MGGRATAGAAGGFPDAAHSWRAATQACTPRFHPLGLRDEIDDLGSPGVAERAPRGLNDDPRDRRSVRRLLRLIDAG